VGDDSFAFLPRAEFISCIERHFKYAACLYSQGYTGYII